MPTIFYGLSGLVNAEKRLETAAFGTMKNGMRCPLRSRLKHCSTGVDFNVMITTENSRKRAITDELQCQKLPNKRRFDLQ